MWRALREHLREPGPERLQAPSRFDVWLAALAFALTALEGAFRPDVPMRGVAVVVGLVVATTLAWRRSRPFAAFMTAFAFANGLTLVAVTHGLTEVGLFSSGFVLLHPYALLRYGSGREVAMGLPVLAITFGGSALAGELHSVEEAIGALVVFCFPAVLGAAMRFRDRAHRHDVLHAQLRERQMLARELHDTVGHHLSAIVIQSQAARAVLDKSPDAAHASLAAIESEAVRSLTELRALVGALREDGPVDQAPQVGLEGIEELVRAVGANARFRRVGDLESVAPAVSLALHRIASESLHNVQKHGRAVREIEVSIEAEKDMIRLSIRNDGDVAKRSDGAHGFGIVGMKERASLLGGSLEAGPLALGGWLVEAALPRRSSQARGEPLARNGAGS